jgi:hypothetical protein
VFLVVSIPVYTRGTFPNNSQSQFVHWVPYQPSLAQTLSSMMLTIINKIILWAPFQTIHNPNPYTRYLSKPSTIPFRTLGTDHNPSCTPGTFPDHPHSQAIHQVPFQAIHIPNPYAGYRPQPNSYSGHLSKPSTFPIRIGGTFPSRPHSQSVCRVPCQTPTGQLKSHRMEDHNSTSNKMENLNKVSSYIKSNDSTITKTAVLCKTILYRHKSSI